MPRQKLPYVSCVKLVACCVKPHFCHDVVDLLTSHALVWVLNKWTAGKPGKPGNHWCSIEIAYIGRCAHCVLFRAPEEFLNTSGCGL